MPLPLPRRTSEAASHPYLRVALAAGWLALSLTSNQTVRADPLSLTTTAKLLAGIDPGVSDPAVAQITAGDAWQQHRKAARAGGRQLRSRLDRINEWQARHLAQAADGGSLIYPFSGPDFVNAYALFPNADTYVFFSLEPPGEVPQLERLDQQQLAGLFGDLRTALNDLVALNFFITPNMKERLQTDALQGTVPVLLAMMGLLDLRVDEVQPMDPWPDRTRQYTGSAVKASGPRPELLEKGVRIAFTNPHTQRQQVLLYLSLDVSDRELKYYPDFLPWLKTFPHPSVLLKSASYLLHGNHFRLLRKEILADASVIVQDDTGLPFKTVKDAGFRIVLFGQYERPVKLFESRFQSDLEDAYEKAGNTEPLPFPFGYNWRKEGKSGLLLALRSPTSH
ncbi:conserved exported hypothetical protein [Burkholderiales bacterium]|jgi:hypothetical protein|nr:conserved exported hypothetical protein [Burkholderiales bacterium]